MRATLITGASGGIGEAFAGRLAAEKHNLVLVARSGDKLQQICDELESKHGVTADYIVLDLTEFEADKQLFEETEKNGTGTDGRSTMPGSGPMGDSAGVG